VAEASLDVGVGETRLHQVRHGVERDSGGRGVDDVELEIKVGERRGEEHQARDTGEEMQHRIGVTQSLQQGQPAAGERIVQAKYLRHAAGPANALPDMPGQAFGCQPPGQHLAQVRGGVTAPV